MDKLKEKILKEGKVIKNGNIIKVDSFIDHQVDINLMRDIAKDIVTHLKDSHLYDDIDKIISIETSGIVLGTFIALEMNLPFVYARKKIPVTLTEPLYRRKIISPTKEDDVEIVISSKYISENERIYIVDDFLATGVTSMALIEIIQSAGAKVIGIGAIIENHFLGGSEKIRELFPDIDIYSCVRIKKMNEEIIEFL